MVQNVKWVEKIIKNMTSEVRLSSYPWSQTEKKLCKKISKENTSVEKSVSVPIGGWGEGCEEGRIQYGEESRETG